MAARTARLDVSRPSLFNTAREVTGVIDLARLPLALPSLAREPRGDGSTVMVLPGFATDDYSTWPLRRYLRTRGWAARGWGLGRNRAEVPEYVERVGTMVRSLAERQERPVALVGWSLGGYIAREVARDAPDVVRRVVTFGSPVIGGPKYTTVARVIERQGYDLDEIEDQIEDRKQTALQVPVTAIYSRNDGVVSWQACIDPEDGGPIEHVEVDTTHLGLGFNSDVFRIVARRLAEASPEPR